MPASLPGSTRAENLANPNAGKFVIFDPLSGPKGSPLDAKITTGYDANRVPVRVADPTNLSTGALSTGIGIGPSNRAIAVGALYASGYDDNWIPGQKPTYAAPPPRGTVATNTVDSTRMYIGGGRMVAGTTQDKITGRPFIPSPYTAGISIVGAGNGGSRDAGAGPAFTGFEMKIVTAAAAVAVDAVVETGYVNRTGIALATGQSTFGSASAATAVPARTLAQEQEAAPPPPASPFPPLPTPTATHSASRA
jgi:hypothetical protein